MFSLLNAFGLDLVDQVQELALQPYQLYACPAEAAILVGHGFEGLDVSGGWRDGLRLLLPAIGKDGAGVELSFRTATVGLAASPPERVEGAGQEGLPCLEVVEQLLDLGMGMVELGA